jgi:hypothetical protein
MKHKILATALISATTLIAGIAPIASAATIHPDVCAVHSFSATAHYLGSDGFTVYHTGKITKPQSSSCVDVQVRNVVWNAQQVQMNMRIRFFPSSGSSYVNSYKVVNENSSSYKVLATNVLPGTVYEIEGVNSTSYTGTYED